MVDDIIFSLFVNNLLPEEDMKKVEAELRKDGELGAAYAASILDYQLNKEYADDILGTDYEFYEKKVDEKAGKYENGDSLNADDYKKSNSTTMKTTISHNELLKVQNLSAEFNKYLEEHPDMSHQEVLTSFYRLHMGEATISDEEVQQVISNIHDGVLDFNNNLVEAEKADGINYKERLTEILKDSNLSNEKKYEILANFCAAIKYLNIDNFNKETGSFTHSFNSFDKAIELSAEEEISDEQLMEMVDAISDEMDNSTIYLASPDTMKDICEMSASSGDDMQNFVLGSEFDVKEKVRAATVTYILYRKGELASFKPAGNVEIGPREIGAFVAAGIEEAKVVAELVYKKITERTAYKRFKTISGAIIFTAITLSLLAVGAMLTTVAFLHIATYVGSASLALILAMAVGFLIIPPLVKLGMDGGEKFTEWLGRTLDRIVDYIQGKFHKGNKTAAKAPEDTESGNVAIQSKEVAVNETDEPEIIEEDNVGTTESEVDDLEVDSDEEGLDIATGKA